ncbi:MAG: amino acid adenylation domain-containing protein, partial [Bacteroidota bacterium]
MAEIASQPFDLTKAPLLRVQLVKLGDGDHILVVAIHHIIADAQSLELFLHEWGRCYEALREGTVPILDPPRIQYRDFAHWQAERFASGALSEQKKYWLAQYADGIPSLDLPYDFSRPLQLRYRGDHVRQPLGTHWIGQLQDLCRREQTTLFAGLTTLVKAFLGILTQENDLVLGTPVSGRKHPDLEDQIGLLVNSVTLRTQRTAEDSLRSFLAKVSHTLFAALEHAEYPFEQLVEALPLVRDLSRNPLFDVWIQYLDRSLQGGQHLQLAGVEVEPLEPTIETTMFDLSFFFVEVAGGVELQLEYNTDLFRRSTIERLVQYFEQLCQKALAQPEVPLSGLSLLDAASQESILALAEGPAATVPPLAFPDLFRAQAQAHPEAEAIRCGEHRYTYAQVDALTDHLSQIILRDHAPSLETPIGLRIPRSEWYPIGILAIQKAGGAFIPIDAALPPERVRYMLDASAAQLLLYAEVEALADCTIPQLDLTQLAAQSAPTDRLACPQLGPEHLSYVLFTSGSTGLPKGALIEQGGMINHQYDKIYELGLDENCRVAHTASVSFDISIWQALTALLVGGTTIIYREKTVLEPTRLLAALRRDQVTVMETVPSYLQVLVETLAKAEEQTLALRYLLSIGEVLKKSLVQRWLSVAPEIPLINTYGPTEAADTICHQHLREVPKERSVPVGRPIRNTRVYVMDERLRVCPVGVKGEICVSGPGVGRGYLNNAEQSRRNFKTDPYRLGHRLYRTGDIGAYDDTGKLLFYGRRDSQIKLRGHRIELNEIEEQLLRIVGLRQAAVLLRTETSGDQYLLAYLQTEPASELTPVEIRQALAQRVPAYMQPHHFEIMDQLPLTNSGKIDRQALAQRPLPQQQEAYVGPATAKESALQFLWKEVLDRDINEISVTADFFSLGGHSLKAIQLLAKIKEEYGVELSFVDFNQHANIRQLCVLLNEDRRPAVEALQIPLAPKAASYPLSPAQRRMWLMYKYDEAGTVYNISGAYHVEGQLDRPALEHSIQQVIDRHEALRTIFVQEAGEARQVIQEDWALDAYLHWEDRREMATVSERQLIETALDQAFVLESGPLLRMHVWHLDEAKFLLLFNVHHIVADAQSLGLLIDEWQGAYSARLQGQAMDWSPLRLQYKDFTHWQRSLGQQSAMQVHREYWQTRFGGELPILDLATDWPRGASLSFAGAELACTIPPALERRLRQVGQREGSTLFAILIASVQTLLYRLSGQPDLIVGTALAGRPELELQNQVGFYVNTLPLRSQVAGTAGFEQLLRQVRSELANAFSHQAYPYDQLVEDLAIPRRADRNPLFDVLIQLVDETVQGQELRDWSDLSINEISL